MLLKPNNCKICHKEIVEDDQLAKSNAARRKKANASSNPPSLANIPSSADAMSSSFVFVQKSHNISQKLDTAMKRNLDAYAEGTHTITHSLCSKCFDYPIEGLCADEKKLMAKRAVIVNSTERLLSAYSSTTERGPELGEAKLSELKAKQAELERQIAQAERHFAAMKTDFLSTQQQQQNELDALQVDFANQAIAWRQEKQMDQERQDALRARFDHAKKELALNTSVINDAFFIWEEPPYFSINNMRLGRSFDDHVVEWQEVNAAWGEVCLLLYVIGRREKFQFKNYLLIPRGRRSMIQDLKTGKQFELYFAEEEQGNSILARSDSGLLQKLLSTVLPLSDSTTTPTATSTASSSSSSSNTNRISNLDSFNSAMVAFLCCLREMGEMARESDRGVNLCLKGKLFAIKTSQEDASISQYSIRTSGDASDAKRWSEACKYTLTNMKWLCLWSVSHQRSSSNKSGNNSV